MKTRDKILISSIIIIISFIIINAVKSILTPFIASFILAYFLNPPVDYLHKKYAIRRTLSTLLILTLFLSSTILLCSYILPIIYEQFIEFINEFPSYIKGLYDNIYPQIIAKLNKSGIEVNNNLNKFIDENNIISVFDISRYIFNGALTSSISLINIISLIFISPILVFYFLKDWHVILKNISNIIPKKSVKTVKIIATDIDKTLSLYIRGQINVCLILGLFYAILLNFSGLNFGFLIGFLTGIFSFIPYAGVLIGVTIGIIVAIFQWGLDIANISIIIGIFIAGQILEGNFITPKLIGDKIGMHPAWIIFGLFFFGALFGFIGILIAVPLTAICSVLIKFLLNNNR